MQNRTEDQARATRILVVDDVPDNLFLMNGLLEDRYEIVQAASGREALEVVMSANPPDIVLLDIMMPDMDGYEVLRRIRQHAPTAAIPIIFLTALAAHQDERLGRDLGAVDYLTKPVNPEQVVQRVQAHVQATQRARLVEALSEKLARRLEPQDWQALFQDNGSDAVAFEHKLQTVLYTETTDQHMWSDVECHGFQEEVEWLALRYGGNVDHFMDGAAVVHFDDATECVRMAMDLQATAPHLHLRTGVYTGACDIATFRCGWEIATTLVGRQVHRAARLAETAAMGSIAVSPETYALVQPVMETDTSGCLLTQEFHDSEIPQVSFTPAPLKGGPATSTFAGLGQL